MPAKQAYECEKCAAQKMIASGEQPPDCCRRPMKNIPLDQCTLTATAEHSRFDEGDAPCDDGRAG